MMVFRCLIGCAAVAACIGSAAGAEELREGRDFSFGGLSKVAEGLSGGVEFECASAYVYNGMVYNDEPIASYAPWLELYLSESFWLYGNFWQLYDLTDRRRVENIRGEWNETDFEAGIGYHFWRSEDGEYRLTGVLGWYWDTEIIDSRWTNAINYPVLNLEFANPYVTPFVYAVYEFVNIHSLLTAVGVKREFKLLENVSLEAKVYAVGGHRRLMQQTFLSENAGTGIASVTGRLTLKWKVTDYLEVGCFGALLGNVNSSIQDDWSDYGEYLPEYYSHAQLVYGGVTAGFSF